MYYASPFPLIHSDETVKEFTSCAFSPSGLIAVVGNYDRYA